MNKKNEAINWEIIQEASRAAAKVAVGKFELLRYKDLDEIQNQCICFILADTPRSKKLNRYTHGDTTPEKLNKLIYSLNGDRSWLDGFFPPPTERHNSQGFRVVTVDAVTAKKIVELVFSGDTMETEAFCIIADKLRMSMSKSQQAILTSLYSNPSATKKQVAIDHGVSWRWVYRVISKAVDIAQREWIPVFER
jgi:hypothetical protein